jgi:hypothetical protein
MTSNETDASNKTAATSWSPRGYSSMRPARARREMSRAGSAAIVFAAICLTACAPAGAAKASHPHRLVLRLPHVAVETGRTHGRSVVGSATFQVSTAWAGGGLTHDGTVDELHVTASPSCTASIEVTTWVG